MESTKTVKKLGATPDNEGVNFSLYSDNASGVELCLFESAQAAQESRRIALQKTDEGIWNCHVPDIGPGQLYGYRVHGPFDPLNGHRFNPHKILIDPYAKVIGRELAWDDSLFGYLSSKNPDDLTFDEQDSAPYAPLAAVGDNNIFDWGETEPPKISWDQTIISELHVKGFTKLHPEIPEPLRGTYLGLASEPIISHLKKSGITALELMPIHYHLDDRSFVARGNVNYWGYNTLSFFAPDPRYALSKRPLNVINEFKTMVKLLHAAGLEVILDVVYNHTAEGNHLGPTLSLKGIDNLNYFRASKDGPRFYNDFSGCGNGLNISHPRVIQLIIDSLRYWVTEMHVDGFRFDLASVLGRETNDFSGNSSFFRAVNQDQILQKVKCIAEPWDAGGSHVGAYPNQWAEWNGPYRDTVRRFWRGDEGALPDFTLRVEGSPDLFQKNDREAWASVNFITCHDGLTLSDLVTYAEKHNEINQENNTDGLNENFSWNCGIEGLTTDSRIAQMRDKQRRNLIATLFLSRGVPLLFGGDELSHSKNGNNNSFCHDNEINWIDWSDQKKDKKFLDFISRLAALRNGSVFSKATWDVNFQWTSYDGRMIDRAKMKTLHSQTAGVYIDSPIPSGAQFVIFNPTPESVYFLFPDIGGPDLKRKWRLLLDTDGDEHVQQIWSEAYTIKGQSLAVFGRILDGDIKDA